MNVPGTSGPFASEAKFPEVLTIEITPTSAIY